MANVIGEFVAKIGADTKGFETGLGKADKGMGKFSKSFAKHRKAIGIGMMAMGAAVGGAMLAMVNKIGKAGDEIAKMAKRTGFATETLSELRHAAELSGTSIEAIEKGIKRMATTIYDAELGLSTAVDAFNELGLTVDDFKGKSPEEQFNILTEALAGVEDASLRSALAQRTFGRAGTEMLPMLADGTEALIAMREEAHTLGLVFDEDAAKAAEAFEDAKTRLQGAFNGIAMSIGSTLMPKITELITALTEKLKPAIQWLSDHPEWIKWAAVASGLALIGGAMLLIIPKVVALISAMVVLHGLMGPAGWVKMAAGLAIAAGVIAGLGIAAKKALVPAEEIEWKGEGPPPPPPPGKKYRLPAMAGGGIVPGPIGKPVPILAHGGERFLGAGRNGGQPITVNVTVQGSVMSERDLTEAIREQLIYLGERNTTTGLV